MSLFKATFLIPVLLLTAVFSSAQTDLEKGLLLLDEGKIEEAKAAFELLLEEDPQNAETHFQMGKTYFFLQDYDKASDFIKHAVELEEDSSIYHQWLGRTLGMKAQRGSKLKMIFRAKKAKKEFEKAVELDPQNLEARFDLLQYYLQAPGVAGGNKEKALEQAQDILGLDSAKGRLAFGFIYEHSENYGEAEQRYVEATRIDSLNTELHYILGFFYQRREQYDKAIIFLMVAGQGTTTFEFINKETGTVVWKEVITGIGGTQHIQKFIPAQILLRSVKVDSSTVLSITLITICMIIILNIPKLEIKSKKL